MNDTTTEEKYLLLKLAIKYHTDKCTNKASKYGYIPYYEKHFRPIRHEEMNILEIGVRSNRGHGPSSLLMWKEYFPNSQIYGLDINPNCAGYDEERLKIIIGDQADKRCLDDLVAEHGPFDIIIDDGSHVNSLTIKSYELLIHQGLKPGGLYIIEDLSTSYIGDLDHPSIDVRKRWEGLDLYPKDVPLVNNRVDMANFLMHRVTNMDMCCTRYRSQFAAPEITSMTLYPMMCVMTKVTSDCDFLTSTSSPSVSAFSEYEPV
tara:strand:+ start:343 stop:1125 length:783 start_codon:yes stop_codon:yes gene_type:complete